MSRTIRGATGVVSGGVWRKLSLGMLLLLFSFVPPVYSQVVTVHGDFSGDGQRGLPDVILLLQYLFSGGALPEFDCDGDGVGNLNLSQSVGDINGDGSVAIVDVIALLNYLFVGGPAPVDINCVTTVVPTVAIGDDWSLPAGAPFAANSGFFSEQLSAPHNVDLRVLDVTWRQLNPAPGVFGTSLTGNAQGMALASFDDQLAAPGDFWMRLWTSAVDWAPLWAPSSCGVSSIGTDYTGQQHLPIWDPCVWDAILATYREVFLTNGLRADPRLRFVFVPGAFTWCEFDFDIISQAVDSGELTAPQFAAWFAQAMQDLVDIFNGENSDPSDDYAYKLVFTGEDFPFGPDSWGGLDDFFARDAVEQGLGIRTGLSELFNFHLSHIPSYGTTIAADGHMVTDDSWPLLNGERIVACENECYNACGYTTTEVEYAVRLSSLKALQMRVNWLYVVPSDSYIDDYPELYEYLRRSLGQRAESTRDAWVALRRAEDRYWIDDDAHTWQGSPWVRNLERWLVQRDRLPDGMTRDGTTVFSNVLDSDNGTAYEGRQTDVSAGQTAMYFELSDALAEVVSTTSAQPVEVKVTFLDEGLGSFWLEYEGVLGTSALTESVQETATGEWRTATFLLPAIYGSGLFQGSDFALRCSSVEDIEVRFVRVLRAD